MSIINCLDKNGAKLDSLGRKGARHDTASAQDLNPWGIFDPVYQRLWRRTMISEISDNMISEISDSMISEISDGMISNNEEIF